jgi:hypothetical protein
MLSWIEERGSLTGILDDKMVLVFDGSKKNGLMFSFRKGPLGVKYLEFFADEKNAEKMTKEWFMTSWKKPSEGSQQGVEEPR